MGSPPNLHLTVYQLGKVHHLLASLAQQYVVLCCFDRDLVVRLFIFTQVSWRTKMSPIRSTSRTCPQIMQTVMGLTCDYLQTTRETHHRTPVVLLRLG